MADWVFDRIPVDLVELCFQFDDRVGYVGIGRRRPAEENDRVGALQHFVVLRFLVLVNGRDRDPDASATPINAPNIVSSMSASFRFFAELLPITASVIYHSSTDFSIQKRRFAWEQREFEKTFSLLQNNTLSRAELSTSAGVAANIHYGDVLIKFGEYLDMRKETFPWIEKQTDADKFRTSFLQDGDVVFADTAEDETAGKCCEIRNCGSMVIISGLHTIPCRPESKFASGYLGYYLNSTAFHEQLVPLMQGTKVVSISKAALKSTFVRYPSDDKEQQKIGTFFRKFDDLLALHQREYNLRVKD